MMEVNFGLSVSFAGTIVGEGHVSRVTWFTLCVTTWFTTFSNWGRICGCS